jgi:hypothetical protein
VTMIECNYLLDALAKLRKATISNKASNIIRRFMDNMKLLLICILRIPLSQYFFINVYMVLFLFNSVSYVFLLHDYVFSLYVYV